MEVFSVGIEIAALVPVYDPHTAVIEEYLDNQATSFVALEEGIHMDIKMRAAVDEYLLKPRYGADK